jgi:hypothetical protein
VAGMFVSAALLMAYFLGIDRTFVQRLSLPLHLLMALAIIVMGVKLLSGPRGWRVLVMAVLVALVTQGLPVMAKRKYEVDYSPAVEMAWRREFLQRYPERDYLFIDQDSVFWIVNQVSATTVEQAKTKKADLAWLLRNRGFTALYVFQKYSVDPTSGALGLYAPVPGQPSPDDLGPDFQLETVWERRIQILTLGRISRVTAITTNGETAHDTGHAAPPAAGPTRTSEELEKARDDYIQQWIKKLP